MITAAQLDYFEKMPGFPHGIGFCDITKHLEQMERAVELFPDFVTLVTALRLSTLQPGSLLYSQHEKLTECWISMLSKVLLKPGPHLEKLIPLTAQLLDANIQDPVTTTGLTLSEQIAEVNNPSNRALGRWEPHQILGGLLKSGSINFDQAERIFPELLRHRLTKLTELLDDDQSTEEFVRLCELAHTQNSAVYFEAEYALIENLHRAELPYDHPARMIVLGKDVSTNEYAERLNLLVNRYGFQPLPINSKNGESDENHIRRKMRIFKELLSHAEFITTEGLTVDFYAALRGARFSSTLFINEFSAFLNELGGFALDMCRLTASIMRGGWCAGDHEHYFNLDFLQEAVRLASKERREPRRSSMFAREFLRHVPEQKLLDANLDDEAYTDLYRLRSSPALLKTIKGISSLENALGGDLGL